MPCGQYIERIRSFIALARQARATGLLRGRGLAW
jgi:hypothetical protein